MPKYCGAVAIVLLLGLVLGSVVFLRRRGIVTVKFGQIDKTDFLIIPFVLFYFYVVLAAALGWPAVSRQEFFHLEPVAWIGALFCLAGLLSIASSLVSFRQSFRIGIDTHRPNTLITQGIFAFSRNPMYVAFAVILFGEFLIMPNWITLIYVVAAAWLFHRQVLREEEFLRQHYGQAYVEYCNRVRRYL